MCLSCAINTKDDRDVETCDVPGAFMQENMDDMIHVRLTGPLATLLTQFDPKKYGKCIRYEKGIPVIYTKVKKSLYGTL